MFKDKMTMLAPPNVLEILLPPIEQCIGNGNLIKIYCLLNILID